MLNDRPVYYLSATPLCSALIGFLFSDTTLLQVALKGSFVRVLRGRL